MYLYKFIFDMNCKWPLSANMTDISFLIKFSSTYPGLNNSKKKQVGHRATCWYKSGCPHQESDCSPFTQMWNIIVKYPTTFQYTVWNTHCETIKRGRNKTIWECPGHARAISKAFYRICFICIYQKIWEWKSNLVPHFVMGAITYPWWD